MVTVNIDEAKTDLSRLVEKAAAGEPFVIAIGGKAMVKVMSVERPEEEQPARVVKRIGGLKGVFSVPDDIKTPFKDEIEEMFYGKP